MPMSILMLFSELASMLVSPVAGSVVTAELASAIASTVGGETTPVTGSTCSGCVG